MFCFQRIITIWRLFFVSIITGNCWQSERMIIIERCWPKNQDKFAVIQVRCILTRDKRDDSWNVQGKGLSRANKSIARPSDTESMIGEVSRKSSAVLRLRPMKKTRIKLHPRRIDDIMSRKRGYARFDPPLQMACNLIARLIKVRFVGNPDFCHLGAHYCLLFVDFNAMKRAELQLLFFHSSRMERNC